MKAIIENAVEAASADMSWKAIDRYSKDYIELQTKDKVRFYRTPDSVLQKQLEVYDQVAAKKSADNPLFKEIAESQQRVRRARGEVGPRHQRQPPHGVQPLFRKANRQARRAGSQKGLTASRCVRAVSPAIRPVTGWLTSQLPTCCESFDFTRDDRRTHECPALTPRASTRSATGPGRPSPG